MRVEIEVELGELAKDWEAVAIRPPRDGDEFLNSSGEINRCQRDDWSHPRLIVRRKIPWPPALVNVAAICRDRNGDWWSYRKMPTKGTHSWMVTSGIAVMLLDSETCEMLGITLPTEWDWTVPILNPNKQASEGASDE